MRYDSLRPLGRERDTHTYVGIQDVMLGYTNSKQEAKTACNIEDSQMYTPPGFSISSDAHSVSRLSFKFRNSVFFIT